VSQIPTSHHDLVRRPLVAALTTLMPDGYPQTHPVWYSFDDGTVLVNTMRGFRKERNMRADPRITVLIVDPGPQTHWIEIRGIVELMDEGALDHLDALAERYTGARHYFGEVVAADLAGREIPVIGRIRPIRVVTDAQAPARTTRTDRRPEVPTRRASDGTPASVPASHRDLLTRPLRGALSTLMPDGHPQTQPVWCDLEGDDVVVNTSRERQKGRNLLADPRATILVVEPEDTSRWIEIRGDVHITEDGALEQLDRLTAAYTGNPHYYGSIFPLEQRDRETRILCRIRPRRVVCDAIHR